MGCLLYFKEMAFRTARFAAPINFLVDIVGRGLGPAEGTKQRQMQSAKFSVSF